VDLRKRRSQEKLQIALAQHLQSQTIDEITIGELTQTAGVSRQTFYSNFDSKQSILLNRIETIFEKGWVKGEALMQQTDIGREEFVEVCIRNLLEECDRDRVSSCFYWPSRYSMFVVVKEASFKINIRTYFISIQP